MRMTSNLLALLLASGVSGGALGCADAPETPPPDRAATQARPAEYDTQTMTVVLPMGDREAGRQAFLDLKCTVCHRVVGETAFPIPVSGTQGPDLDRTLGRRPPADLAAAIVVPSHSMSVKTSAEVKKQLEGMMLSPMPDFSRTITVRQLADLLVYLTSRDAGK